jgi:hypothetical protein
MRRTEEKEEKENKTPVPACGVLVTVGPAAVFWAAAAAALEILGMVGAAGLRRATWGYNRVHTGKGKCLESVIHGDERPGKYYGVPKLMV